MKKKLILIFNALLVLNCGVNQKQPISKIELEEIVSKKIDLTDNQLKIWWQKDIIEDTIPGISLEKAYNTILKDKKGQEVIVAVIDTKLEINHEDLKSQIWVNKDEIPNNNNDDDNNGYVDDVNGWNFLGNKNGVDTEYQLIESVRFEKKYKNLFENKREDQISKKDLENFLLYKKVQDINKNKFKSTKSNLDYMINYKQKVDSSRTLLNNLSSNEITLENIKEIDTINNDLGRHVNHLTEFLTVFKNDKTLNRTIAYYNKRINYMLNIDYDERKIIADNENDITNNNYGNNIISGDVPFKHSISVSGVLASNRKNNIGINGFSDNIRIMPVVMVASGDEHDKDVALAIRYAVDNGAKIINMSWGKYYSSNKKWVFDAMKYAEKNNVLLITSAGNDNIDNDIKQPYPKDSENEKEFLNNFMSVGASTHHLNENLKADFSNYGKHNVDIFAPGENIYTTEGINEYEYASGTSFASPIVSGIAALILSNYPNFTAKELKEIILESGISLNIKIEVKNEDKSITKTSFNDISKTGKIVNVFNALILAERLSKSKNQF